MRATYDFDRLVEGWLQSDIPLEMSTEALDEALGTARRVSQRRGVRAWLAGPGAWPAQGRPGILALPAAFRLALVVGLLLAGAAVAAVVGSRLLTPDQVAPGALVYATEAGLFIANPDGSNSKPIRTDGAYRDPHWSPRGDTIAVLHRRPSSGDPGGLPRYELLMVRADGEITGRVTLVDENDPGGHEWLAAGPGEQEYLAVTSSGDTDTTAPEPNGMIAPTSVVDRSGALLLERTAGRTWTTTSSDAGEVPVLVYSARQNGDDGIYAFDPSHPGDGLGSRIAPLVPLGASALPVVSALAVSPLGSTIAFVEMAPDSLDGTLFVALVAGGAPKVVATGVASDTWLSWSPDGRSIVATLARDGVPAPYSIPVDGPPPTPVFAGPALGDGEAPARARWSTDGSRILAEVGCQRIQPDANCGAIYTAAAVGQAPTRVVGGTAGADLRPRPNQAIETPATPAPTADAQPAPDAVRGMWLAANPDVPELNLADPTIRLTIDVPGRRSWGSDSRCRQSGACHPYEHNP